jgi:hypothetical protein
VHLAAVAGRLGIEIDYQAFDNMGRQTLISCGDLAAPPAIAGRLRIFSLTYRRADGIYPPTIIPDIALKLDLTLALSI